MDAYGRVYSQQGYSSALQHMQRLQASAGFHNAPHPDLLLQHHHLRHHHPPPPSPQIHLQNLPSYRVSHYEATPQVHQIQTPSQQPPAYNPFSPLSPLGEPRHHLVDPRVTAIMQNNPQQQGGGQGGGPGINMNQLVRAQHIQNLPNLTIQQKNQLVTAVSQCAATVQNAQPGSNEHTRALIQWQNITQRYMAARQNAAKMAANPQQAGQQGGGAGGGQNMQAGGGQQGNMGQGQGMPQQQAPQNMGGQQQGGGAQNQQGGAGGQPAQGQPQIPQQIMDYVNKFTYYHPNGIGPGHPKYEEYRQDVKIKHAKILYDNERNKAELKKIRVRIEQQRQSGQEVPQNMLDMERNIEQKTNDLGAQLNKWSASQRGFKEKYEQMQAQRAAQQGQSADQNTAGANGAQMNMGGAQGGNQGSPVAGPQQQGNQNRAGGAMSPGVPNAQGGMNNQQQNNGFPQAAGAGNNQSQMSQQTPQSATAPSQQSQQRPGISGGQQPPMPNMQPTTQGAQQSGNPTPLSHQQALQRAYSGGTPQSAGAGGGGQGGGPAQQPHPAPHSQPYAGGQAPPRETSTTSNSNLNPSAKMMSQKAISPSLSQPPVPIQNFPQSRPTMAGPANGVGGIMGQPAIAKQTFTLDSTEHGGVLSKKKLDELVRQVTGGGEGMGGEMLTPEVEEVDFSFLLIHDIY